MLSIQEILNEVSAVKQSSEKIANDVGAANIELASQSSIISSFVQGSRMGQESVMALSVASRSLADAVSSIKMLSKTCEICIAELSK